MFCSFSHSPGFDAFSFDPHKFATDYHLIGFRECATEVARYLAVHEGIDFQDPLRLRLMTHLHTYSSQRELSLKACTGWNPNLFTTPMYPPLAPTSGSASSATAASSTATASSSSQQLSSHSSSSANCDSMQASSSSHHNSYSSTYSNYALDSSMMAAGSSSGSSGSMSACTSSSALQPLNHSKSPSASFSLGYSSVVPGAPIATMPSMPAPIATSSSYSYPYTGSYFAPTAGYMPPMVPNSNNLAANASAQSSVKHYRPWGTELAY